MFWRAEFWQQLLQLANRHLPQLAHPLRALLGTWPGLLTLTLLLVALITGGLLFWRASDEAAAQSPSPQVPSLSLSGLAQLATPTRRAAVVVTATRTPTPTLTPTATPMAVSPLLSATALTATVATTPVVPLPADLTGPQIVPADVITATPTLTTILTATGTVIITDTTSVESPVTSGIAELLLPTPTPTLSINEALAQPVVVPGGMAGIVATATAGVPVAEPATDAATEPTVEEGVAPTEPHPIATVASQPTPDGIARTARVPILMYHYLSVPPAGADIYRRDLSVAPDLFAAHLDAMLQAGYTPITLYAMLDHLTHGAPLPEKPVVLTFDDGYRDNYTNAFPLLRDRGVTATFFIVTDFIHTERPEYVTWDMVREMYAAGMSIEGHGRNHVSLANKDNDYLIWQALGTFESIEVEIGVRPRFISYPAGEYDQRTIDIFRSANYWAGFTTKQGATHSSDDLFQLRRVRVRGATTTAELLRLLALDW